MINLTLCVDDIPLCYQNKGQQNSILVPLNTTIYYYMFSFG